jgi:hypothetical protein
MAASAGAASARSRGSPYKQLGNGDVLKLMEFGTEAAHNAFLVDVLLGNGVKCPGCERILASEAEVSKHLYAPSAALVI